MGAVILIASVTTTISKETGYWIFGTRFYWFAKGVFLFCHYYFAFEKCSVTSGCYFGLYVR